MERGAASGARTCAARKAVLHGVYGGELLLCALHVAAVRDENRRDELHVGRGRLEQRRHELHLPPQLGRQGGERRSLQQRAIRRRHRAALFLLRQDLRSAEASA